MKTISTILQLLWRIKLKIQRFLLALFSAIFSILLFVQVIFRYVLDIPLFGLEEIASYMALWVYFIGAGYACYERYHISASLVDVFLSEGRVREFIDAVALLIGVVILTTMAVWCWQYLAWTANFNMQSVELGLPMLWINSISFIGLCISAFYMILEVADKLTEALLGRALFPKPLRTT